MVLLRSLCDSVEGPCGSKLATIVAKFQRSFSFLFLLSDFFFLFILLSFLSLFLFISLRNKKQESRKIKKDKEKNAFFFTLNACLAPPLLLILFFLTTYIQFVTPVVFLAAKP